MVVLCGFGMCSTEGQLGGLQISDIVVMSWYESISRIKTSGMSSAWLEGQSLNVDTEVLSCGALLKKIYAMAQRCA